MARTWHVQLGIFWIATAWLAAGLYIGPAVSGVEPKWQRLGVNVLFGALLLVVVGSLAGQWLSVKQMLGTGTAWFYFGHSGYEYIDLGRLWQIALLAGLFLWLVLMVRAIRPALRAASEQRPLLVLFLISSTAIAGFYAAALGYGRHTNLAMAEYWRWWVVHLWVEGFFEVFATVVIAFLFSRLKLVALRTAAEAERALGHHLPVGRHHRHAAPPVLLRHADGGPRRSARSSARSKSCRCCSSASRRGRTCGCRRAGSGCAKYRWPIYFFVAVAFWNLVGAGLFGFMINPPIALYYMQGLNTTPVHGHAALFGVYGMLGIGLMLFSLRALDPAAEWKEGLRQVRVLGDQHRVDGDGHAEPAAGRADADVGVGRNGYWYARSPEFLQTGTIETFRWMRVIGDTIFAAGAVALAAFVLGLRTGGTTRRDRFRVPAPASTAYP